MYNRYKKNNRILKKEIRSYMRVLRKSLTLSEQYIASQLITNKIISLDNIQKATHIAIFISIDGEINTNLLIQTLLLMNKIIYLPKLPSLNSQYLSFVQYNLSIPLIRNRLNIYEPKHNTCTSISPKILDILFIPLVAFDEQGNRLGMGGGFYDKILNNWGNKIKDTCVCIGLGYDFQKIPTHFLPVEPWDVKLSKIITPSNLYIINE